MAAGYTLEDVESKPFQCHFNWGLTLYSAGLDTETIIEGYKFRLARSEQRENIVEQFAFHTSLAYTHYVEKNFKEYEAHIVAAEKLSTEDPGLTHVYRANFFYMLQGVGMSFQGKSIDSFVDPYTSLSSYSQAIIWTVRSLTLRPFHPSDFSEAIKGYEKAISLDPENYHWQLRIGDVKRKQRKTEGKVISDKPELPHYIEAVRLGGPKLPMAIILSEINYEYRISGKKSHTQLGQSITFVHDLMIEILLEEHLLGRDYAFLGKFFHSIPFTNMKLARECFEEALFVDGDNSNINLMYAKDLMLQKQETVAMFYLEKAIECSGDGYFTVAMELMQLRSDLNENYDIINQVQELLKRYKTPQQKATLYCKLGNFLRNSQPDAALKLYQSAVKITEEAGLKDWGKHLRKYLWQQKSNGSGRTRISKKLYEFYDIYEEIALLEKEMRSK